jgi:hypothetical protein
MKPSSDFSAIPIADPVDSINGVKKPRSIKIYLLIAALAGMGIGAALTAATRRDLFLSLLISVLRHHLVHHPSQATCKLPLH